MSFLERPFSWLEDGGQRRVVTGGFVANGEHTGGLTSFGLIVVVWRGKGPLAWCQTASRWLRCCPWEGGGTVGRVRVFVLCFLGQVTGNT